MVFSGRIGRWASVRVVLRGWWGRGILLYVVLVVEANGGRLWIVGMGQNRDGVVTTMAMKTTTEIETTEY